MTAIDKHGRLDPPVAASEETTLLGYLDYLRGTIAWKTEGLSDEQLHAHPLPSAMTLGGILKHLAFVEWYWFAYILLGEAESDIWSSVDWDADPDWDWHTAADDTGHSLRLLWGSAVGNSRRRWATFASQSHNALSALAVTERGGQQVSGRWILVHLVEEYARHCGHADLLREAIDGATGD